MKPTRVCSAIGCDGMCIARGLCSKHYQRWKRDHPREVQPTDYGKPAIERLLSRCIERDGCWIYTGSKSNGYARLRSDDGRRKVFGHRLSYEFFIGPIADDLTFDHLCETRACVNPWHGDLVPLLLNIRRASRGMATLNRSKTECPQGHPLRGDNLVPSAKGRICRACRKETNRRYRARKKAAA